LFRRHARLVVDQEDFGLQERTFLVDAHEFEALAAFGKDVEAAVGIFLCDRDDFGRASDFGQTLFEEAHYAEGAMPGEAVGDHFLVAWLEDVQGQGSAGEQDDIERE
jgi:hypothetical protein